MGRAPRGNAARPHIRRRYRPRVVLLEPSATNRRLFRGFWHTSPPRKAMEILLLRHGESEGNAEGRMQGRRDYPLSALGRDQAARAAAFIRATGLELAAV